jgi:hypothetical protein
MSTYQFILIGQPRRYQSIWIHKYENGIFRSRMRSFTNIMWTSSPAWAKIRSERHLVEQRFVTVWTTLTQRLVWISERLDRSQGLARKLSCRNRHSEICAKYSTIRDKKDDQLWVKIPKLWCIHCIVFDREAALVIARLIIRTKLGSMCSQRVLFVSPPKLWQICSALLIVVDPMAPTR